MQSMMSGIARNTEIKILWRIEYLEEYYIKCNAKLSKYINTRSSNIYIIMDFFNHKKMK